METAKVYFTDFRTQAFVSANVKSTILANAN